MTTTPLAVRADRAWWRVPQRHVPVLATFVLLLVMYGVGVAQYRAFSNIQVIFNIFIDNGFLLVVAVGMTFVILTGGIDLSVGSVVAMTAMVSASLLRDGMNPALVLVIALLIGPVLGFAMGCVIHYFDIQPFIVTLAGMFFARGMCTWISSTSIPITDGFWTSAAQERIRLGENFVSVSVLIALAVVAVAAFALAYTRLGRNVYAIGGNPQSALLMGLPVGRTKIAVYTISGLCSAIGGILLSFYTLSGAPLIAIGMELDVIAAVVIGGTLLTGGSGYVFGTVLGVLVLGVIQTLITFDGSLSSWWTKIVIGALLFAFILLQRLVGIRKK
ncbi:MULTISPECIES: galactofuranose ABC transporter, permease protein YjfF [unclassified Micromonospora]|uniref:galactofuranose ABC transporter, permease protein YjfF n=1 Tax=unclassified Micromonospora TaxID=2617518 RepID=UPI0010482FB8|nr:MULTISPECIES: galactofuranose ABC transporter, permease protein YjfF [unclassified Micromonospora]TDB77004.1 sugar ABC transporter permease YjfF [Micromonospora sp. KC721]TDC34284.1 sugar ABC transporter permease YjfF [Micromonospora sp. KC213]